MGKAQSAAPCGVEGGEAPHMKWWQEDPFDLIFAAIFLLFLLRFIFS